MSNPNTYALIMAGGAGTRLWPLSRKNRPKPLLSLVEAERSMFQMSVERLYPLFSPDHIFVVANAELTAELRQQAPDVPEENYIIEPIGRNTAPAIGLGAIHIRQRDPNAIMVVLTADHHINDTILFRRTMAAASKAAAEDNSIVTLGINPTFPATGFGYIERGLCVKTVDEIDVYDLVRFVEKPSQHDAVQYLNSGHYSWNSGMFIWQVSRVMNEFKQHTPEMYEKLEQIATSLGSDEYKAQLAEIWKTMPKVSVDYALMEHISENVCVVPVDMGWNDIGNFEALYDILSLEEGSNVSVGPSPLLIDTNGTIIYSKRFVATLGVEDLIIVDTDDVLMIAKRDRAQEIRQLVEHLEESEKHTYL
jgi:mannose-1-phosphate guanylyltransferase